MYLMGPVSLVQETFTSYGKNVNEIQLLLEQRFFFFLFRDNHFHRETSIPIQQHLDTPGTGNTNSIEPKKVKQINIRGSVKI